LSMSNLGHYPTLTSVNLGSNSISANEFHSILWACPCLLHFDAGDVGRDSHSHYFTTHLSLESLTLRPAHPVCILDSLLLPNLRTLGARRAPPDPLIRLISRSSCTLRHLEVDDDWTEDQQRRCLHLVPYLETLAIYDGHSLLTASPPPLLPLLHNHKITTSCSEPAYNAVADFLELRRGTLQSIEINLRF
jgi:hypothetical protein